MTGIFYRNSLPRATQGPTSLIAFAAANQGDDMKDDEIRSVLTQDIENYRKKIAFYKSLNLFEAAHFADKLAENIELALTTMHKDDDPEIA
jgi:hypothetical protein